MTTYSIVPARDGFHIAVVGDDGARQTMLGFESMEDAETWVLKDKRLDVQTSAIQDQEATA